MKTFRGEFLGILRRFSDNFRKKSNFIKRPSRNDFWMKFKKNFCRVSFAHNELFLNPVSSNCVLALTGRWSQHNLRLYEIERTFLKFLEKIVYDTVSKLLYNIPSE